MVTESMDNMGTYEGKILFNLFKIYLNEIEIWRLTTCRHLNMLAGQVNKTVA